MTVMVAQKQVGTRFISSSGDNAPTGTLVNNTVTVTTPFPDFYLIAQTTTKGTASPTRYVILQHDSPTDLPLKALQEFTYQQCFMYANFAAGIRMPAPVRYAARLCELLLATSLKGYSSQRAQGAPAPLPKESLAWKLYYI